MYVTATVAAAAAAVTVTVAVAVVPAVTVATNLLPPSASAARRDVISHPGTLPHIKPLGCHFS